MIIAKVPLRISFVGGGTDLPQHYTKYGGGVISGAIQKYVYIMVNKRLDNKIRLSYSVDELVDRVEDIKHDLIREVLLSNPAVSGQGLEITTISEVPLRGTGLGASSAVAVGLFACLYPDKTKRELAELAVDLELNRMGKPIGVQDQYACAMGGVNHQVYETNGAIYINPIRDAAYWEEISRHLLCVGTGTHRNTDDVFQDYRTEAPTVDLPYRLFYTVQRPLDTFTIEYLGAKLTQGWEIKSANPGVSNSHVDKMIELGTQASAFGAKLLGAGGGGFILYVATPDTHQKILDSLEKYMGSAPLVMPIHFDFEGVTRYNI